MQAEFAKATVNVNVSSDSAATLHTAQFAKTVRNSVHSQRVFAMFAHLYVTVTAPVLVRTGIPSTPTSSSSNQTLSTLKQARTLKQAGTLQQALSRMNSQTRTFKQYSQANKIYKQELSSMNTQHQFSSKTSQEQEQKL